MYLVLSRILIHETKELVTSGGVHELVNSWDQERIFWACFAEVRVIDTDPLFFIGLLHHYYISEPFRVVNFPYELGCK